MGEHTSHAAETSSRHRRLLLTCAVAAALAGCAQPPPAPSGSPEDHVRDVATGPVEITHDGPTGVVLARVPLSVPAGATAADKASAFLAEYGAALGVDPGQLVQTGEVPGDAAAGDDSSVVVFAQSVDGVPVVGSDVRVEVSMGDATADAATSHTVSTAGVSTTPTLSADDARAVVAALAGLAPDGMPTLAMIDAGFVAGLPTTGTRLVWAVETSGADRPIVYVDAQTGAVLARAARVETERRREVYDAQHTSSFDLPGMSVLEYDEAGAVAGRTPDAEATALYDLAGRVYDYYHDTFGRDGHDDRGTLVRYYTHFTFPGGTNAAWLTGTDSIVFDDGTVTDDIGTHELTHGLVEKTSGFIYEGWSGALNESTADVFAMMFVRSGWTVGTGSVFGELRDLADPTVHGQPRYLRNAMTWPAGTVADFAMNDNLGVHTNSGIFNYVGYLITEGGRSPDTGIAVQGIGYDKAEQIYYRALTRWSGPAMRPEDHRIALRLAALRFAQAGTHGITATDCGSVIDALAAVGIGDADTDGDCFADGVDNCPTVPNFDQLDANHNGTGDACEGDAGPMCRTHIQRCTMDSDCCGSAPGGTNICELGQCVDGAMCVRVGSVCGGTATCCEGVRCAAVGTLDPTPHCCARDADPCTQQSDCCGTTECVSGRCQCRAVGQSCVTSGDCCGSSFCSAGVCATS